MSSGDYKRTFLPGHQFEDILDSRRGQIAGDLMQQQLGTQLLACANASVEANLDRLVKDHKEHAQPFLSELKAGAFFGV